MTTLFNHKVLISISVRYSVSPIKSLSLLIGREKPKTKQHAVLLEAIKSAKDKTSFLVHPERLIADSRTSEQHKLQYLYLASLRDYNLYVTSRSTVLLLSYYPDLELDALNNTILELSNNTIKFKYED